MRNMRRAGGATNRQTHAMPAALTRARTPRRVCLALAVFSSSATLLTGCAAPAPSPKEQLTVAYRDLDQRQYDSAYVKADAVLRKQPAGRGSAEALYLQGRVSE